MAKSKAPPFKSKGKPPKSKASPPERGKPMMPGMPPKGMKPAKGC